MGIAPDDPHSRAEASNFSRKLSTEPLEKSVAGFREPACPSTTTQQSVLLLCLPTFREAARSSDAKL